MERKTYCTLRIDRPVACSLKVKRLVNHANYQSEEVHEQLVMIYTLQKNVSYQQMREA